MVSTQESIAAAEHEAGYSRRSFLGGELAAAALALLFGAPAATAGDVPAAKTTLLIGVASIDITRAGPVELGGQFGQRRSP